MSVIKFPDIEDLLEHLPNLRKCRTLNAETLRILMGRDKGECTWCGQPVAKGRQTWCSDRCVKAFKERCCSNTQRLLVLARDNHTCRLCGLVVRETRAGHRQSIADLRKAVTDELQAQGESSSYKAVQAAMALRRIEIDRQFGYGRGRYFEVDHQIAVCEGGGLCSLENLRLVCGACHAVVTAKLVKRRSVKTK